jgi:RNA polymerase subunit RPABC4/transcription elongation factor Spt4
MDGFLGAVCPVCKNEITNESNVKICPSCGVAHHNTCWEKNNGCSTFGCSEWHDNSPSLSTSVCKNCGYAYSDELDSCPECGSNNPNKISNPFSNDETSDSTDDKHVSDIKVICKNCGFAYSSASGICPECGNNSFTNDITNTTQNKDAKKTNIKKIIGVVLIVVGILFLIKGIKQVTGDLYKFYKESYAESVETYDYCMSQVHQSNGYLRSTWQYTADEWKELVDDFHKDIWECRIKAIIYSVIGMITGIIGIKKASEET